MPSAADPDVQQANRLFASVIIAVYNDWAPLANCLQSLAAQTKAFSFEVIVVDDGSTHNAPASILEWMQKYRWKILRQPHLGPAAARNHGIRQSVGEILVFTDADCILEDHCFAALGACIAASPSCGYFQLCLAGVRSNLPGKAEDLRLIATQSFLLQPDGCIRYMNTAGFAVRRSCVDVETGLFDERALRAEDSLLLANLMRRNQLPFFVRAAAVRHPINLSVLGVLRRTVRSALLEAPTHAIISTLGIKVLMNHRERFGMLRSIWRISKTKSIGRAAFVLLVARQTLRLLTLTACRILPRRKREENVVGNLGQV
ncbi:MAG: glycosyltransferase family 2 protein [Acidobacteria bacterium]|nr:glycosyltransferase family 2 protein [Acidobacteriota bacterium]